VDVSGNLLVRAQYWQRITDVQRLINHSAMTRSLGGIVEAGELCSNPSLCCLVFFQKRDRKVHG
jgi:hypothetical protein